MILLSLLVSGESARAEGQRAVSVSIALTGRAAEETRQLHGTGWEAKRSAKLEELFGKILIRLEDVYAGVRALQEREGRDPDRVLWNANVRISTEVRPLLSHGIRISEGYRRRTGDAGPWKRFQALQHRIAGLEWCNRGDFARAARELEAAVELGQEQGLKQLAFSSLNQLAYARFRLGWLRGAVEALHHAIDLQPESASLGLYNLGWLHLQSDNFQEASDCFDKSISGMSRGSLLSGLGWLNRGIAGLSQGRFESSEEGLTRAVQVFHDLSSRRNEILALFYLARVQAYRGEIAFASRSMRQCLALLELYGVRTFTDVERKSLLVHGRRLVHLLRVGSEAVRVGTATVSTANAFGFARAQEEEKSQPTAITLGTSYGIPGAEARVPLNLLAAKGVQVGTMVSQVTFDPEILEFLKVEPGYLLKNKRISVETKVDRDIRDPKRSVLRVRIATPADTSIAAGLVAEIVFRVAQGAPTGEFSLGHSVEAKTAGEDPKAIKALVATDGKMYIDPSGVVGPEQKRITGCYMGMH
ncbi:MAG: hypothetical protein HY652_02640 [Acidobacteria bacterium]|nr:hypothetical protein [Acidobacteriota bacterium]